MSSISQVIANRANAQLSTGPKTEAGVAASRHNATKTGLTGKQIVIKGEDPAAYDALREELLAEYTPQTEVEAMYVEQVTQNLWRLRRARSVEREVLDKYGPLQCIVDPEARKAFSLITRYLNGIERSWQNACRELQRIQDQRKEKAREAAKAAFTRAMLETKRPAGAPQPASGPIGFVSQNSFTDQPKL